MEETEEMATYLDAPPGGLWESKLGPPTSTISAGMLSLS